MHRFVLSVMVALATALTASAQTLYFPASANAEGVNQTRWRTDLQVKAQGGRTAAFSIELLESRADNRNPISLAYSLDANESLRLGNVLETEFGFTGTAALRITATEGRITATSRTYNDDPGGTYGQTVPAVAEEDGVGPESQSTMILLSRSADPSAGFRTNIGLVNLTGSSTAVDIDVHAADGTVIGSLSRNLKPFEHRQFNDVFDMVGAGDVADGYAVARSTAQDGSFLAYASVVDNGSGDAVFILGSVDTIPAPAADRLVVFESFLRPG
jgi:hypothetical protein